MRTYLRHSIIEAKDGGFHLQWWLEMSVHSCENCREGLNDLLTWIIIFLMIQMILFSLIAVGHIRCAASRLLSAYPFLPHPHLNINVTGLS